MQDGTATSEMRPEFNEAAKRTLEENADLYRRLAAGPRHDSSGGEAHSYIDDATPLALNANTNAPMLPRAKYIWIVNGLIAISLAIVGLMLLEYISIPMGLVLFFSLDPVILITAVMLSNAENDR